MRAAPVARNNGGTTGCSGSSASETRPFNSSPQTFRERFQREVPNPLPVIFGSKFRVAECLFVWVGLGCCASHPPTPPLPCPVWIADGIVSRPSRRLKGNGKAKGRGRKHAEEFALPIRLILSQTTLSFFPLSSPCFEGT